MLEMTPSSTMMNVSVPLSGPVLCQT